MAEKPYKKFLEKIKLLDRELQNIEVTHVFNSIGSNIFLELGEDIEIRLKNGKKRQRKQWSIWVGNASWRITKNGKCLVGSVDARENIEHHLRNMLGKRFQGLRFNSHFLDAEFLFDEGYQLTTFFDHISESQWSILFPDQSDLSIDCDCYDAIKKVQLEAKHFVLFDSSIRSNYTEEELIISKITFDDNHQPSFYFENTKLLNLKNCTWRLEKDSAYIVGYLDGDQQNLGVRFQELVGSRMIHVKYSPSKDATFTFDNQYVLTTFINRHLS